MDEKVQKINPIVTVPVSELKPDIIVVGDTLGDLSEMISCMNIEFDKVGPMETADCDGIPCSILYLKKLYDYMDDPSEGNLHEANSMFKLFMEMSARNRRVDELNKLTYNELKNNEYMHYIARNAEKK
ncbi:MAG: hypothetical protein HQK96_19115, partial [Nitrospirae bacterium]|nr:hypothetical protein [Nitrospirota bacterium]